MYKYIKIFIYLIPILILLFLFNKQYPLNGELVLVQDLSKPHPFVGKLNPAGRVDNIKKTNKSYTQTITGDPVYFDLELPDDYQSAKIHLKYQSKNQPIIKIGGLVSNDIWNFETKTVQNSVIDNLGTEWKKISDDGKILFQKNSNYKSIDEFLNDLPAINQIAVFDYDLAHEYIYPKYQASNKYLEINQPLKGMHSFLTYIGEGEDLDFEITSFDINEHEGTDEGQIEIYKDNIIIKKYSLADDGITKADKTISKENSKKIQIKNIESGVYKINLLFNDDLIISKIKTKQNLISFVGKLNLYHDPNKELSLKIFSNSKIFRVATNSVQGVQKITINKTELNIAKTNVEYVQKTDQELSELSIPKSDIIIQSSELFSFSKDQFFNPTIKRLTRADELASIDYIITSYTPVENQRHDKWREATVNLDITKFYKDQKNRIKFMISAPNLTQNEGEIVIDEIKIILQQKTLLQRIINRLQKNP